MPNRHSSSSPGSHLPTRREVLSQLGGSFGGLALAALFGEARGESARLPARIDVLPRSPPAPARAKAVIQLFMHGGPSHVDLLDPKPMLFKHDGATPPAEVLDDEKRTSYLLGSPFKFAPHGESGVEYSELLPHIARHADEIAVVRSMYTEHR